MRAWFKSTPGKATISAISIMILLLITFWRASKWYQERLESEIRSQVTNEVALRAEALSLAMNLRFALLQGLSAFVQVAEANVDFASDFETYASVIHSNSRGIRNIAISPMSIVQYVYPLEGNEQIIGYDPFIDDRPGITEDVLRGIETGKIIVSGPVELLQGGMGLIARLPVYINGEYWGLVNVILDMPVLLEEGEIIDSSDEFVFALRDEQDVVIYGEAEIFNDDPVLHAIDLPESVWMLAAVPAEGWEEAIRPQLLFFQFSGVLIVLLLTGLVYFTINRQAALAQAVEQRTKEISLINENLEQRVANRTKELSALYDVMAVANSSLDLQDVMIESLAQIIEVMDCEIGSIHLLDYEHDVLHLAAWQGTPMEVLPQIKEMPLGYGAAGQVIAHDKPLVIPVIEMESNAVPAATQVLAGHAYIGSPMKAKEKVLGVLSVIGPIGKTFDEEEVSLLASIADQVGVAVENAQLYKQAEELAIAEERQRMAREIHDTLAQGLTGIKLQLDAVESALELQREELALERLSKARQLSSESLTEARRSVWALNAKSLEGKKLSNGLRDSIRGLTEGTGIEVKFDIIEAIPALPSELERDLLRIAQEAVVNAVKHANANTVHIYLAEEGKGILLKVEDDGKGFTIREDHYQKVDGSGFGLIAMQDRINRHGGSLIIESKPNQGTTIIAKVDL